MSEKSDIFYEILFSQPIFVIDDKAALPSEAVHNASQSVLVVCSHWPLFPQEEELLSKILQAAAISPAIVKKISIEQYQPAARLNKSHILFFVHPEQLPPELATWGAYVQAPVYENTHVIIANDLSALATDIGGKRKLWDLLKKLFLQ